MTDLQARLLKVLATRKAAHARWYVTGEDTSKNRAECKALGEADDALELFVHAECYDIADELSRLTDTVERLEHDMFRIAFPDEYSLRPHSGNASHWPTWIAYRALGGRIEVGVMLDTHADLKTAQRQGGK